MQEVIEQSCIIKRAEGECMKAFFNNLKLGRKMLLAPVVIFIFLIIIASGAYVAVACQGNSIDDIYNKRFKGYQNSSYILVEMSTIQTKLYKVVNWIASNYDKRRIEELARQTDVQINATVAFTAKILNSKGITQEERKLYQIAYDNLIEYKRYAKTTLEIAAQDSSTALMTFGLAEDKFVILEKSLQGINALEDKLSKEKYEYSKKTVKTTLAIILITFVIAIVLSLLISISVTKLILTPIQEIIIVLNRLADGDLTKKICLERNDEIGELVRSVNTMRDKMNESVGQALQVSEYLKDSASEEAAAIEESSASLDEIASMTRQNTDNTIQANKLMLAAKEAIMKANVSMEELSESITEIEKSSEQTQKIVQSIDEIAFQTNLLALNASVEAARAGEVGAGFAVVAAEVRSLAKRAKESANDSSDFIADIVQKVRKGQNLVKMTNAAFEDVTLSSKRVVDIMREIAAASREQAQGIDQVNVAIAEMSSTSQQTASNAEILSSVMSMFKTENTLKIQ